jgi:hypothetical protein
MNDSGFRRPRRPRPPGPANPEPPPLLWVPGKATPEDLYRAMRV